MRCVLPSVIEEYRSVEHEIRVLQKHQETAAWQRCRPFVLRDGDKKTAEGLQGVVMNYFQDILLLRVLKLRLTRWILLIVGLLMI